MLEIQIQSPIPIYEQLATGLRKKILSGALPDGSKLPTIRTLARQLDIAVNTVARAYQELEREGIIVSNGRKGSYVCSPATSAESTEDRIFKPIIITLLQSGRSRKEIEQIFRQNLNQIFQ